MFSSCEMSIQLFTVSVKLHCSRMTINLSLFPSLPPSLPPFLPSFTPRPYYALYCVDERESVLREDVFEELLPA